MPTLGWAVAFPPADLPDAALVDWEEVDADDVESPEEQAVRLMAATAAAARDARIVRKVLPSVRYWENASSTVMRSLHYWPVEGRSMVRRTPAGG